MAKGYWVVNGEVWDAEQYKKYAAANAAPFAKYGAKFLVRGGASECVEGEAASRTVVIEFESYDKAMACYKSPEYQAAIELRKPASKLDIVIVHGYEGPQPGDASR
jgi:uncharacterized protein (DUF1330 family)